MKFKISEKNNRFEDFLLQENEGNKGIINDTSLSEGIRVKLKSEVVSPFRRFRQFILFGLGAAAGLGAFTAIPQLIKAFTFSDAVISKETALTNTGVDIAGIFISGYLLYNDFISESKTIEKFTDKEKKLINKLSDDETEEREKFIAMLPVEIQVSESNENITKVVSFGDLQSKGNQNVVIVFGKKSFVKDAIISARIEGTELFVKSQTIVVPVVLDDDQIEQASNKKKGFGASKEELLSAPYFGKPAQVSF